MTIKELIKRYEVNRRKYGSNAYKHISSLLKEAKILHKKAFFQSKTAQKAIQAGRTPDHEQSWRAFKGKNLEKLIEYIITEEVEQLGLKVLNGNTLERTLSKNLSN